MLLKHIKDVDFVFVYITPSENSINRWCESTLGVLPCLHSLSAVRQQIRDDSQLFFLKMKSSSSCHHILLSSAFKVHILPLGVNYSFCSCTSIHHVCHICLFVAFCTLNGGRWLLLLSLHYRLVHHAALSAFLVSR